MAQASRVNMAASALGETLDGLADALVQARADVVADRATTVEGRVRDFQQAAREAIEAGAAPSADALARLTHALTRCRRLGASLTLLAQPSAPLPDAPLGYGPVGQPLPVTGEGTSLTARV